MFIERKTFRLEKDVEIQELTPSVYERLQLKLTSIFSLYGIEADRGLIEIHDPKQAEEHLFDLIVYPEPGELVNALTFNFCVRLDRRIIEVSYPVPCRKVISDIVEVIKEEYLGQPIDSGEFEHAPSWLTMAGFCALPRIPTFGHKSKVIQCLSSLHALVRDHLDKRRKTPSLLTSAEFKKIIREISSNAWSQEYSIAIEEAGVVAKQWMKIRLALIEYIELLDQTYPIDNILATLKDRHSFLFFTPFGTPDRKRVCMNEMLAKEMMFIESVERESWKRKTPESNIAPPNLSDSNDCKRYLREVYALLRTHYKDRIHSESEAINYMLIGAKEGDAYIELCKTCRQIKEYYNWERGTFMTYCKQKAPKPKGLKVAAKARAKKRSITRDLKGL